MNNATHAPSIPSTAVSVRHAAAALELPENTIRQAIHTGRLPAAKIGNRIRIAKTDLGAWLAEHLLEQEEAERPTGGAPGTEVEHLPGCSCEDRETDPAMMLDERTVTLGLHGWVLSEVERRLRVQGRPLLRWRKNRWNSAGEQIGPELAIRSCEVEMLFEVMAELKATLDRVVGEPKTNP